MSIWADGHLLTPDNLNYKIVAPRYHPKDHGAAGDGTTDDTTAVQAAFTAATAAAVSGASVGTAVRPIVDLGSHKYRLTSSVDIGAYASIEGHRAAILPDAGVTAFTSTAYQQRFRGVVFIGGAKAVAIASNNVNTCTLHFDECEFQDQTSSCIESDTSSASSLVTLDRCRFYVPSSSATLVKAQCLDQVAIKRSWITCGGTAFQVGSATKMCNLTVEDCLGVPTGGSTLWIKNYGHVVVRNSRFTGEAGAVFAENHGAIDSDLSDVKGLVVEDCQIECAGNYYVKFYEVPNQFVWRRVRSTAGALGFSFETGGSLSNFRTYLAKWQVEEQLAETPGMEGVAEAAARAFSLNASTVTQSESLTVADKVLQISNDGTNQYGVSQAQANYTQPAHTHDFGASTRSWRGDSASYNGSASEDWTTALNGLSSGWYTAVFDIEVTGTIPVTVRLFASDRDSVHTLAPGKHLVNLPFYFNSSGDESVGYELTRLNNAKTVALGPVRVFSGQACVRTQNNILYGTAAPGSLRWEVGDRVVRQAPTAGQPIGWRCTVAGTPGTWVAEANL